MKFITSRDNPAYKRLRSLVEESRTRREESASIIDGDHLIQAALTAHWPIRQLVVREDLFETVQVVDILAQTKTLDASPTVLVVAEKLFRQLSPVVTPSGLLAEIAVPIVESIQAAGDEDVLALAGVQDAGNLGTLLRTAVAAGFRHVWLDAQTVQAWSPKALRAGMGAQFNLVIREGCNLPDLLRQAPQQTLATSLESGCVPLYGIDLRSPCIWVFGSEGQGVPREVLKQARTLVHIPMPGRIESLNVSAAAAICLFEQVRQRLHA